MDGLNDLGGGFLGRRIAFRPKTDDERGEWWIDDVKLNDGSTASFLDDELPEEEALLAEVLDDSLLARR